ncbi:MAG TPA: hypothetical protein VEG39_14330 [Clostridia bacterium]|nr:hypothetical protein [Clostridia bacterium]
MKIKKAYVKYVSLLVGLMLVFQTVAVTSGSIADKNNQDAYEPAADDRRIADEISNMSGVKAEDIIKLKKDGRTWNEVLEAIKSDTGYKAENDSAMRDKTLLYTGLGADAVDKLKAEGFGESEIMEAKTVVERVLYQLEELQYSSRITEIPAIGSGQDQVEDPEGYKALLTKLELKKAVAVILKVKKGFNNIYEAMDEYLCALQLDMNIEEMLIDNSKYEAQKQEKLLTVDPLSIITVASIETKLMDKFQAQNLNGTNEVIIDQNADRYNETDILHMDNNAPQLPEAEIKDVKPIDPAEELMKEISGITEKSMGAERR